MAYGRGNNRNNAKEDSPSSPAIYTLQNRTAITVAATTTPRQHVGTTTERTYDDIDSRETYRSNGNVDWSRTSFKIKKSKPGKVRHLSRQELFGIGMSFLLSISFALIIAAALVNLSPIVWRNLLNFIYDVKEVSSFAKKAIFPAVNKQVGHSTSLEILTDLSGDVFMTHCYKQMPCLFTINSSASSTFIKDMKLQLISDPGSRIHYLDHNYTAAVDVTVPDFLDGTIDSSSTTNVPHFSAIMNITEENKQCSVVYDHPHFDSIFSGSVSLHLDRINGNIHSKQFSVAKGFISFLLEGKKHWVIFKQDQLPRRGFNAGLRLEEILQQEHDKFQKHEKSFEVVQNVGEFVYIPEGWFSSYEVFDSKLSSSIVYEAKSVDTSSYFHFYSNGKTKLQEGDIVGAIRFFKLGLALNRNVLLLEGLGDALAANSQYLAAEEFYREVLTLNPQAVSVYSKLINLFVNHATKLDVSESIKELLTQADSAGTKEHVLQLVQENL